MSIYQFKAQFQNLLRPISQGLVAKGYHANHVTVLAVILSAVAACLIAKHAKANRALWYVLPAALFVRMAMNAIDGMMAKEHGQASTLGAWLNEIGDLSSDALLFFALLPHLAPQNHCALYRVMLLSTVTELVAIATTLKAGRRTNHGPMGKSDRALALGVLGIWQGAATSITSRQQHYCLLAMQLLLLRTIYNRYTAYQSTGVYDD